MLTQDQIEEWGTGEWEPDPQRPFIVCPMGSGARTMVMRRFASMNLPSGVRVIAVVRTRVEGEMLRKIGFEWIKPKQHKDGMPHLAVVTIHALPKLHPLNPGDWLIASDWRMLGDYKTKVSKVFFTSTKLKRFCVANSAPHVWSTLNVAKCLGVADQTFRQIHDYHASRHANVSPNFVNLFEPDHEARREIITYFNRFTDSQA